MSEVETGALGPGRIEPRELEQEMRSSFLDYAMSVIVSRALPDVRDGLKPVHRRVLYGMHEAGMPPNRPYKKCARIVGDVMGSYHPHGEAGIAVGMATNMPPHNLGETIGAIVELIDNPDADADRLMRHIKGPDFPTGAIVVGRSGIRDAYRTGRGRVVMRARAHIEELR